MKISIFGMGYVGAVSAGCLANDGHDVIGVDSNQDKIDLINRGKTPIVEKDIGEMILKGVQNKQLRATSNAREAVFESAISLICVGTPSQANGDIDLSFVRRVCEEIGCAIKEKSDFHVVVARSTMLPGSMNNVVIPTLEHFSGKSAGKDFGVCNNPEFLREGTAVYDYYNPPKTVIGETDPAAGDVLIHLYEKMTAPIVRTDVETAEMVKYTDNNWHAVKVTFANEIGNLSKALGIDGHKVMEIFCKDTKLNLSPYYMKPGFAFGGSCLPKDVRALSYKARSLHLELPLLSSLMPSNRLQIQKGLGMVTVHGNKRIGILGFAFKAGTDDLRESPVLQVIESLVQQEFQIRLYDQNVNLSMLSGANLNYVTKHHPGLSQIMVDSMDDLLEFAEVIVIGNDSPEFHNILERIKPGQVIVDLVRIAPNISEAGRYDGICW